MNPTQPSAPKGSPQMPQQTQQFSPAVHHVFEQLRNTLMMLHSAGIPGIDRVLQALNQVHVEGMKGATAQPTMPQGPQAQPSAPPPQAMPQQPPMMPGR